MEGASGSAIESRAVAKSGIRSVASPSSLWNKELRCRNAAAARAASASEDGEGCTCYATIWIDRSIKMILEELRFRSGTYLRISQDCPLLSNGARTYALSPHRSIFVEASWKRSGTLSFVKWSVRSRNKLPTKGTCGCCYERKIEWNQRPSSNPPRSVVGVFK